MVTTRGGTETPGAATPMSSAKKGSAKRGAESLDTPSQAKRARRTGPGPARTRKTAKETSSPEDTSTGEDNVDTPSTQETGDCITVAPSVSVVIEKKEKLPIRARTVSEAREDVDDVVEPAQATPRKPGRRSNATADIKQSKVTPKKTRSSQRDEEAVNEPEEATSLNEADEAAEETQKAHVRFGSEDPEPAPVAAAPVAPAELMEEEEDDDDASDSDEAPEMVTTAAATSKVQAAKAEAGRALQAKKQAEEEKRKKREERIAEEQAQKRIREEKKAKSLARKLAKQEKALGSVAEEDEEGTKAIVGTDTLPDLLPDSLLATIDEQRPLTPPPEERGKTAEELHRERLDRHIKFLETSDKPVKDVKKGKLSVAVLGKQNKLLAPKVSTDARSVREQWLQGQQLDTKKKHKGGKPNFLNHRMQRTPHGSKGFLRGEDD